MTKNLSKKLKKFVKQNIALSVVVALALVIGLPAMSAGLLYDDVVDRISDKWLNGQTLERMKETAFGAITLDRNRFDHGIEIITQGLVINSGGFTLSAGDTSLAGALSVTGTTTIGRSYDGYWVSGSLAAATGTATTTLSAWEVNTGQRRLCQDVVIDQTGHPDDRIYFSVSTSTYAGNNFLFNRGLIASTTVATATQDILSKEDNEGGDTRDWWNWDNGVGLGIVMSPYALLSPTASSTDFDEVAGTWGVYCRDY